MVSAAALQERHNRYNTEAATDDEIERRLHELTLDFGVVNQPTLSRPLQTRILRHWRLELWLPKKLGLGARQAADAFEQRRLPLVLPRELERLGVLSARQWEPSLVCDSFWEARTALDTHAVAALLPSFLAPGKGARAFFRVQLPKIEGRVFDFCLAWNPRLLRLNPHAVRRRDWLAAALSSEIGS